MIGAGWSGLACALELRADLILLDERRAREVAQRLGTEAYMVDNASELQAGWFDGKQRVGLTAGASAPDILVQQVIERLRELGAVSVRKLDGITETIKFPLPKGLKIEGDGPLEHIH